MNEDGIECGTENYKMTRIVNGVQAAAKVRIQTI